MATTENVRPPQIFLSYAQADKSAADRVADALREAENRVWFDSWELKPSDSIVSRIEQAVASSDFLVVLLSPRSISSRWVQSELGAAFARELDDRAITVIPAVLEDCEIPPPLAHKQYVDLRHDFDIGVQRLASQLSTVPDIDFSRLDSRTFERLVADLLVELGFSVQPAPLARDSGFDFVASYRSRDPFGAEKTETWLVEAKFYREQRVSVSALRQMLGFLITSTTSDKGLVVTNGRMTSVATEFLADLISKSGRQLRVIDGTELASLLTERPALVQRYLARTNGQ